MRRILVLAAIWGWSFVFIKVAVRGVTPPTMACTRCALGALALLALCRARGLRLPRDRTSWRDMAVMGLVYSAVPFTLLGWGEQRTTSALASVCQADTPLFTALFSVLLLGERLRRPHLVGLVVGFSGVAVCAGLAGGDLAHSSTAGALAEVASGACYGLAFTYARRHLGRLDPVVAATGQLITGTLFALPVAAATTAGAGVQLTAARVGALLVLGVIGTGLAYAVNYASIAAVGATRASLVTYLVPIVAVAVGILVLGEPFQSRVVLGGAVIVAGIALVQGRLNGLRRLPVIGGALAALVLGACSAGVAGGSAAPAAGCAAPRHDALDPRSVLHLLPGAPEPPYQEEPPTSGAHEVAVPSRHRGVVGAPLSRPLQVGLLEKGQVIVQYRPATTGAPTVFSTAAGTADPLVADRLVTIAPSPGLPAPVVVTAWTWHMACGDASPATVAAVTRFVRDREAKGPETPPPGP